MVKYSVHIATPDLRKVDLKNDEVSTLFMIRNGEIKHDFLVKCGDIKWSELACACIASYSYSLTCETNLGDAIFNVCEDAEGFTLHMCVSDAKTHDVIFEFFGLAKDHGLTFAQAWTAQHDWINAREEIGL